MPEDLNESEFRLGSRILQLERLEAENRLEAAQRAELDELRAAYQAVVEERRIRIDAARGVWGFGPMAENTATAAPSDAPAAAPDAPRVLEFPRAAPPASDDTDHGEATGASGRRRDRRDAIDAYIAEYKQVKGKKLTRKAIWKSVGYQSAAEFERWQRYDRRATKTATEYFEKLLAEKPHLK